MMCYVGMLLRAVRRTGRFTPGSAQIFQGRSGSGAMLTKTWKFGDGAGNLQFQSIVVDLVRRTVTESWEIPTPRAPPGKGKGQPKKTAPPQQNPARQGGSEQAKKHMPKEDTEPAGANTKEGQDEEDCRHGVLCATLP